MDWFLYDRDFRHERVKGKIFILLKETTFTSQFKPIFTLILKLRIFYINSYMIVQNIEISHCNGLQWVSKRRKLLKTFSIWTHHNNIHKIHLYFRYCICIHWWYIANQNNSRDTIQKMKFFIKDFLSKCDQISSFLPFWSHLLKRSLMENFIFCAVRF